MTLRAFNLALDRFINEDVPEEVGKMTRAIALETLRGVVLKTPVKTGRARGGWLTTVDERDYTVTTRLDTGGQQAIAQGVGAIAGVKPFQNVVIQNNVEYIEALEDGSSKQSPAGMVAVTVASIEAQLS